MRRAFTIFYVLVSIVGGYFVSVPLFGHKHEITKSIKDVLSQEDAYKCVNIGGKIEWDDGLFMQQCSIKTFQSIEYEWFYLLDIWFSDIERASKATGDIQPYRSPNLWFIIFHVVASKFVWEIVAGAAIFGVVVMLPFSFFLGESPVVIAIGVVAALGMSAYAVKDTMLECGARLDPAIRKACSEIVHSKMAYSYRLDDSTAVDTYNGLVHALGGYVATDYYRMTTSELYNKAIADFDGAILSDPKNVLAYLNRGLIYAQEGHLANDLSDYDKAIADFGKAIEIDPRNAFAHNNRGFVYRAKGDNNEALADWDMAIEIDPKEAIAK